MQNGIVFSVDSWDLPSRPQYPKFAYFQKSLIFLAFYTKSSLAFRGTTAPYRVEYLTRGTCTITAPDCILCNHSLSLKVDLNHAGLGKAVIFEISDLENPSFHGVHGILY